MVDIRPSSTLAPFYYIAIGAKEDILLMNFFGTLVYFGRRQILKWSAEEKVRLYPSIKKNHIQS